MAATDLPLQSADQAFADAVLGPPFMGWATQILFAGIAFNMCFNYVSSSQFSADSRRLKLLLLGVMTCLVAQCCLTYIAMYHYGTWQLRDSVTLYGQTAADCWTTFPSGIVGAMVQSYLLKRASALFRRRWLRYLFIGFSALVILAGFFGAMLYVALSYLLRANELDKVPATLSFNFALGLWSFCSALVDLIITISLVFVLKAKIMGFSDRTDGILRKLIHLSVATAVPTTIVAIMGAALAFAFPDNEHATNSPTAFWLVLPSLYSCSFLSTLAAREKIRIEAHAPTAHLSRPQLSPSFLHAASFHQNELHATHAVHLGSSQYAGDLLMPSDALGAGSPRRAPVRSDSFDGAKEMEDGASQ
ncbi:hypothetical protein BCR35DRAFT_332057 [Leucosporidium creatinivorum]|uniref:DUF6534 domain-containing protein n=1 Tax=Leucosporidium creatinivorum TaxID=106004 RepID=A0A1Y2F6H3_9BASI|nr:hypothetical protein BCR35DRAFT_332057 [Leucosporidium creatinivorum]